MTPAADGLREARRLEELRERIEKATGPDRALDALIHRALTPDLADTLADVSPGWLVGGKHPKPIHVAPYTASIDAALAAWQSKIPGIIELEFSWEAGSPEVWPSGVVRWYPANKSGSEWHANVQTACTVPLTINLLGVSTLIAQQEPGRAGTPHNIAGGGGAP